MNQLIQTYIEKMPSSTTSLTEALINDLQVLYEGETQIKESVLNLIPKVKSVQLQSILSLYGESADSKRLQIDRILSHLSSQVRKSQNEIINNILEELQSKILTCSPDVRDLLIVPVFQQICFYKISAYQTAYTLAEILELDFVAKLLKEVITSEQNTDMNLMKLAYREFTATEPIA